MNAATKTPRKANRTIAQAHARKIAEVLAVTVHVVAISHGSEEWVDSIYESLDRARSWAQFMREHRPAMRVRLVAVHGRRAAELIRLTDLIDFYSEDEADMEKRGEIIAQRDTVFVGGPWKGSAER